MGSLIRRQSPALVVAIIALIAAFGGSALAGGGPITKKKSKKIANNVVTQRAPGLSVANANTANVANKVGPLSAAKFDYRAANGAGTTTIGTFGGLVLQASCPANTTNLQATTTSNDAEAKWSDVGRDKPQSTPRPTISIG